jgi:hypothetical protein
METTLFVAALLATLYFYERNRGGWCGAALGLALWARPEALIFLAVLCADALVQRLWVARAGRRPVPAGRAALVAAVCGAAYAAFNLALSGTLLPNTYAAKLKYYARGGQDFPLQVLHFATDGHMLGVSLLAIVALAGMARSLARREAARQLVALGFPLALFAAYATSLPYLYQQGRYMMPALPFLLALGLRGLAVLSGQRRMRIVALVVLALFAGQFVLAALREGRVWAADCRYITERQVRTAKWIGQHLPREAVVATHDIGAIAFYGEHRVADMVGLVSPAMVANIGDLGKLREFLRRQGTTHLAVLRNWFEIDSARRLFATDESRPEIMEVFEFDPDRTHFTPQAVSRLLDRAAAHLARGEWGTAGPLLEQAVLLDGRSSRARELLGRAYLAAGALVEAERQLQAAIELFPENWAAREGLARVALARGQPGEGGQ